MTARLILTYDPPAVTPAGGSGCAVFPRPGRVTGMEARVGARMEVVTPKRRIAALDAGYLVALLVASLALHGWIVSHTFVTARDAIGFARLALNLGSPATAPLPPRPDGKPPTFIDVLRAAEHPPGYPVTVLSVSYAVRPVYPAPLPEAMLLSCRLATAVAGVLLVIPTYLLGRSLFGRFPAFAATLLFQVLPVPAHVTSDGLSEGLYLLCATTALGFGVRGVRHRSTLNFLLCGMAAGAAYLVRPEGLMIVLAVGAVVAGLGILRRWPRDVAAGRLAALGVGVLIVATPYMVLIGKLTNKTSPNELLNRIKGNPKAKLGSWDNVDARHAAGAPLFGAWADPQTHTDGSRFGWAAKELASEVFKTSHYTPAVLAVVGIVLCRRRIVSDPALAVLPVVAVINLSVLYTLGLKMGYVSERHTLLVVLVGCYFAAAALEPIARCLGAAVGTRAGTIGLVAAVVASALPATLKPLHENRVGHYYAGKFLATVVTDNDVVIDPFCWAEFYAGRSLNAVPPDPPDAAVVYAVVEYGKDNPHSRLPRHADAVNVANDGWSEVVFRHPEEGRPDRGVMVVKLDRAAQDAVRAVGGGPVTPFLVRR